MSSKEWITDGNLHIRKSSIVAFSEDDKRTSVWVVSDETPFVFRMSVDEVERIMVHEGEPECYCVCSETSSRNCQVHQNNGGRL